MAAVTNSNNFSSSSVGLGNEVNGTRSEMSDHPTRSHLFPSWILPSQPPNQDGDTRHFALTHTRKRTASESVDSTSDWSTTLKKPSIAASHTSAFHADNNLSTYPGGSKPKPKRVRVITERRREQCRNNQARYRVRQRSLTRELEGRVQELREDIDRLTQERYAVCYGTQTKHSVWTVVVEYFRLLRYGYNTQMRQEPAGASHATKLHDQECFLKIAMSPDVSFGEVNGVDALIEQWKRYSSSFGDLHLQLKKMEQESFGVMTTSATLSLTITVTTLMSVFPHLLGSSNSKNSGMDAGNSKLAHRLLGQRLDCRCSIRFMWDDKFRCITQLETQVDFLAPLLKVLGSLEDVSYVLEKARITPGCLLGGLDQ